jgi:hypothetical protein
MPSQSLISGTDGLIEAESQYVFVVYEKDTGTIHHVHQVVNLSGAQVRERSQMEQTALSYVSPELREKATTGLAVLSVPSHELERGRFYRVDHERQVLLAVERKP